jgi:hypothetical protein
MAFKNLSDQVVPFSDEVAKAFEGVTIEPLSQKQLAKAVLYNLFLQIDGIDRLANAKPAQVANFLSLIEGMTSLRRALTQESASKLQASLENTVDMPAQDSQNLSLALLSIAVAQLGLFAYLDGNKIAMIFSASQEKRKNTKQQVPLVEQRVTPAQRIWNRVMGIASGDAQQSSVARQERGGTTLAETMRTSTLQPTVPEDDVEEQSAGTTYLTNQGNQR